VRLLVVVAAVAALLVGTTANGARVHKVDSGIRGEATAGPTCPVERYPPDPQCAPRPYQATVRVRRKRTGKVVKTFTARKDGTFKVRLRPGGYRLEPTNKGWPRGEPEDVTVHAHKFAHVHLEYDTGIR
jgi:hypothetical protein